MSSVNNVSSGSVRMTQQAALVFITATAVAMLAVFRNPNSAVLSGAIMFALAGAFEAYSVNCMMTGGCDKFAWLNALLFAVPMIMLGVALIKMDHFDDKDESAVF